MSPKNTTNHHEPDDPDIADALRARREQLGLSVLEAATRAGVSEQTWRNYERGRTQVRGDKQLGVWEALGWEPPAEWAGLESLLRGLEPSTVLDAESSAEDLLRGILEGAQGLEDVMRDDADALGLPAWDDVPTTFPENYSPLLAATLGEDAARCFALGAYLYEASLSENLDELSAMPRGTHVGELENSHIGSVLPPLWLTRYDYEFVFQLRGLAVGMRHRLVETGLGRDEPLARSVAEVLIVHDVFTLGGVMGSTRGAAIDDDAWEGWVNALTGPAELAHQLLATAVAPPSDVAEHFENWFMPLTDPFVPAWCIPGSAAQDGDGATVTRLRHR